MYVPSLTGRRRRRVRKTAGLVDDTPGDSSLSTDFRRSTESRIQSDDAESSGADISVLNAAKA